MWRYKLVVCLLLSQLSSQLLICLLWFAGYNLNVELFLLKNIGNNQSAFIEILEKTWFIWSRMQRFLNAIQTLKICLSFEKETLNNNESTCDAVVSACDSLMLRSACYIPCFIWYYSFFFLYILFFVITSFCFLNKHLIFVTQGL